MRDNKRAPNNGQKYISDEVEAKRNEEISLQPGHLRSLFWSFSNLI